ncbi:MAG: GDSL-type esterase/lipase family protein [Moraxella sp.]|uniref:GDSL-type esterase/lipase family protein n=1 Tax=Moraxella sp. TaxID=479 RepID=UPI0026DB0246|nr:GDSL-type esterase/lipase family protein [Moraxella sp.]MDO4449440.1 GDSL-type esterase/lipase family protein [Moraxella sp.]
MSNRRTFLQLLALSPTILMFACGNTPKFTRLPVGSKVVALGDSLTFGYGGQGKDYPSVLAELTGWQIENMGVNGDTTADVLRRIEAVIEMNPKLVLLGIGGNDVLKRVNPSETKSNLIRIIEASTKENIDVVLIAEPYFSVSALFGKASDNPIYKEVADELSVPLFANGWSKILSDDKLKSDQIHANGAGYAKFAQMLFEYLKGIGYV